MPEPSGTAKFLGEIFPGVYRWSMQDDRIQAQSDSYAVMEKNRVILIDPLPMEGLDLAELGLIDAICLTASCHERAAWRYRELLKVPVYAPAGVVDLEGTPDRSYRHGDRLPGGLIPVHCPGLTEAYYSFHLDRDGGVVFCADLLINAGGAGLIFLPDNYHEDPARTRGSLRRLLDLDMEMLCPAHGNSLKSGVKDAIRGAFEQDAVGRQKHRGQDHH